MSVRSLLFALLALIGAQSGSAAGPAPAPFPDQVRTRVQIDASLLKCVAAYRAAVEEYMAGHEDEATNRIARLDPNELRKVAAVLLAVREIPANVAAPETRSNDRFVPFLWDTPTLLAAGLMHMDIATASNRDQARDRFTLHTDLAHVMFGAAASRRPGEPDARAKPGALALALLFLHDQNLVLAKQRLTDAIRHWPDDADLLLIYGTVIETEATSPYPVQHAGPPRRGAIVVDPVGRERAARTPLLREAARLFERVLELDKTAIEARIRLAHVLVLQKDDEHAAAFLDEALAASPRPEWAYTAQLMLGDIRERAGQLDSARRSYERAIAAYPGGQSAYIALGHVLHAAGDRAAAESAFDRLFDGRRMEPAGDPWWGYPLGRRSAADGVLAKLRATVRP